MQDFKKFFIDVGETAVEGIVNKEKKSYKIRWNMSTLAENDVRVSVHKLTVYHWNPKQIRAGGWREYLIT